eukprot:gene15810-biopygen21739
MHQLLLPGGWDARRVVRLVRLQPVAAPRRVVRPIRLPPPAAAPRRVVQRDGAEGRGRGQRDGADGWAEGWGRGIEQKDGAGTTIPFPRKETEAHGKNWSRVMRHCWDETDLARPGKTGAGFTDSLAPSKRGNNNWGTDALLRACHSSTMDVPHAGAQRLAEEAEWDVPPAGAQRLVEVERDVPHAGRPTRRAAGADASSRT